MPHSRQSVEPTYESLLEKRSNHITLIRSDCNNFSSACDWTASDSFQVWIAHQLKVIDC